MPGTVSITRDGDIATVTLSNPGRMNALDRAMMMSLGDTFEELARDVSLRVIVLTACPHPVVAMIRGACVGGGLEIAASCDMRICGESSRFGVPVKNLGLVMAYGELKGLVELVGRAIALEIVLEGRVFGALEAKDKGLVNRVVPADKVEEESYATARRIADGAPLAARWHKKFAHRLADPRPLSAEEYDESFACFGTADYKEGVAAFLAKRKPVFKGT